LGGKFPTIALVVDAPHLDSKSQKKHLNLLSAAFLVIQAGLIGYLLYRGTTGFSKLPLIFAFLGMGAIWIGITVLRGMKAEVERDRQKLVAENDALVVLGTENQQILADHEAREQALIGALELAEIQKSMQEHASRRFQSLFEGLPLGAATFDNEGTIFEWNPQMSEVMGVESHFAILHPLTDGLLMQSDPGKIVDVLEAIFERSEMVSFNHSYDSGGDERTVSLKFFPLKNRDGDVIGGIVCGVDVTEELLAQRKILEMAALQSAVLNAAEYSIVWADEECRIIGMNRSAEELLGYTAEESIGEKFLPDFHLQTELFLRQAEIESKTGIEIDSPVGVFKYSANVDELNESEWQYLRADDETVSVSLSLSKILGDDGSTLGYLTIAKDITEAKATAERLQMLSMVAQESMNSILILDASGHILFANPAFSTMSGYEFENVVGLTPFKFRSIEEVNCETRALLNDSIRRQVEVRGELQFLRPDGSDYWARVTISPVRSESGFCTHLVVIEDDISQQKEIQLQVLASEARFRDVVESAGEYIWETNEDMRFTYVSPKVTDVLGYLPEEILGRSPLDFVDRQDVRTTQNKIVGSQLDGLPVKNLLLKSTAKHGGLVWQRMNAIPVFDTTGELSGFRGTGLDVTEQKMAEDALASANMRVKRILESINDSFYSLDSDGRFTYVNSSATANSGLSQGELIGVKVWDHMPDEFWEPVRELFCRVGSTGVSENMEFYVVSKGTWLEFRVYANQDGGISVFYKDISSRKDTERRLSDQMAAIHEANVQMEIQQAQLKEANEKLMSLASTDGLTGLKNHKTFQEFLADQMTLADRVGISVGVSLMDVDKFKLFNDGFGHVAGDDVLKRVAATLQRCVQEPHFVARYGGEEFVIVGVGLTEDAMYNLAEECRASLEEQEWPHRQVTASFGISMYAPGIERAELIDQADQALYASKENGRNRVSRYSEIESKKVA
jgi:diguanylate cyclase (GGDEF)-like protein/PAS domain S-box-containing protein